MYEDPLDMFREMDKIFAHLVTRMTSDFTATDPQSFGFHMIIQQGKDQSPVPDCPDYQYRAGSEPVAEVHRIGDELKVITELPGATMDAIRIELQDLTLSIDAVAGTMQYHTTAALPPVDPSSIQTTFKNGVLEVTFRILTGTPENEES